MRRFTLVLSVALLVLVSWQMAYILTTPHADSFHFTVTADMRGYHSRFGNLLQAINDGPGPGIFHVSIGDIDGTIPENRAQIDDKFGTTAIQGTTPVATTFQAIIQSTLLICMAPASLPITATR